MNRIQNFDTVTDADAIDSNYEVEFSRISAVESETKHTLFAPMHYEHKYAYPLIVWLHGPRDNEHQLKRVMPLVSMRNYVAIAPRGTVVSEQQSAGPKSSPTGYQWGQDYDSMLLAEHRVFACIELAKTKFKINSERVFLAGYNSGGTAALRIAMNHPQAIRGGLSLCGAFPTGDCPLRRLNEIRQQPLFLANGCENEDYPQSQVCADLRLFHSAGLSVTLRQYPCGDELTTLMLADMDRWIMEQICPQTTPQST